LLPKTPKPLEMDIELIEILKCYPLPLICYKKILPTRLLTKRTLNLLTKSIHVNNT